MACFVEGGGSSATSERILRHLDGCVPCRILLANMLRAVDRMPVERRAASIPRTLADGEIVSDRYRIDGFIAQGGMGEVYKTWDLQLHETVALKTIACTGLDNEKLYMRIRAEVQIARRVTHPNVCRILEFGLHCQRCRERIETIPFFTMEYLTGETLAQHISRRVRVSEREILPIALQILGGLAAIHAAGIVHRDLKPDNVFLMTQAGGELRVVLMDFGLARPLDTHSPMVSSHDGGAVGTPAYMAPEQALGTAPSTAWDIYAFGVILYKLASGELPFTGNTTAALAIARLRDRAPRLSSILPGIEPSFEAIVSRCLQRDPNDRFASVRDVAKAIAKVDLSAEPHRPTPRRRYLTPILAIACLTVGSHYVVRSCVRSSQNIANALHEPQTTPARELTNQGTPSRSASAALSNGPPETVSAHAKPVPTSTTPVGTSIKLGRASKRSRQASPPATASAPLGLQQGFESPVVPATPDGEEVAIPSFAKSPHSSTWKDK